MGNVNLISGWGYANKPVWPSCLDLQGVMDRREETCILYDSMACNQTYFNQIKLVHCYWYCYHAAAQTERPKNLNFKRQLNIQHIVTLLVNAALHVPLTVQCNLYMYILRQKPASFSYNISNGYTCIWLDANQ